MRYTGSFLQLTIGDKGSYFYASFGAPITHEDDTRRAVAAALELRAPPPELDFIQPVQIGIRKTTYILENIAFLAAGFLCLRNWRSSQIVSGGTVWLALGLGMLSYFIGNLLLAYWEVGLGQEPAVSPGDFFFILTYMFLGWGMLRAVISRELNLTPLQWVLLSLIAVGGVVIAIASGFSPPMPHLMPPAVGSRCRNCNSRSF
ncbi:MAG: hypothetical protein HC899_38575 [Leptolyngbyaceae cyanobacterium SM1_4_3]|nr:hypothetical protein [Leptolyngbyaceae cyanobacterium SM1_4_3]